ncbi:uncharacterized protein [Antedon mediterranea]|uniref:uncharacterized protein n=1 Tax=Antedon mediterranea TaxID=105859 RepID=UPI003AF919B7
MYEHRMTNLEFILFWIRSVFVNVRKGQKNKIMLIGTHYESLGKTEQERQQRVQEIKNTIWKALKGKPYWDMVYQGELFTIENSVPFEKSGASKIILQIQKFVQMMIRTLPIKWLQVMQEIQQLRKELYLPKSEINDLLARCKITDRKLFLEYLHDIGEILFYPDDKILKEKIVIDLMGVVDKFKTIITVIDPELQESFKQLWSDLNEGKLDQRLLQHIWKDEPKEMIDFFVSLMQTFGLMCEKRSKKNDGRMFYVLSRLKPQRDDSTTTVEYEEKHAVSLFHDFDGYLPDDLFQRVATKFIEEFQMEDVEPTLSYEHVELDIDGNHLVVLNIATINNCRMFQTTIVRRENEDEVDPQPRICQKVLSFLQNSLPVLSKKGARGVEIKMYIRCDVCSNNSGICRMFLEALCRSFHIQLGLTLNVKHTHMHVVRKFDKDALPCRSKAMDMKRYCRLFGENTEGNKPVDIIGELNQRNLALLHDTINITKQGGLRDKLRESVPSFPNVEGISSLSHHRQQVLSFFSTLSNEDVCKINGKYNNPQKKDWGRWEILFDLEKRRRLINQKNWNTFIEGLKKIDIERPHYDGSNPDIAVHQTAASTLNMIAIITMIVAILAVILRYYSL